MDYLLPDMSSYNDGDYDDDDDEDSNNDHDISDDESLKHSTIQESYLGSPDEVKDNATNAFSKGDPTFNCVSIPMQHHYSVFLALVLARSIALALLTV